MFKEKILSLGGAIILLLISIVGTYFITSFTKEQGNELVLPTLPPINTQKPSSFSDNELFHYACIDSFDVEESEIKDLLTFKTGDRLVAFDNNGITLCYSLDELTTKKPANVQRLIALLGLSPSTSISSVFVFKASSDNVFRPAFITDSSKNEMSLSQATMTDEQQQFINSLLLEAANKNIAYTRLGYTYDYKGNDIYGVTQFASDSQYRYDLTSYTVDEFLAIINE